MNNRMGLTILLVLLGSNFCMCSLPWMIYENSPFVKTDKGFIKGVFLDTLYGEHYAAFMSVPFAKPPLGRLRFKAPVEEEAWTGVRDASVDSAICTQNNPYLRKTEVDGSEDCLYINIYAPEEADTDKLLPVMIFFHGGGWMTGSGNKLFYGPDRLMDHKIVLVGVNYRLGALGLLSTEDEACPGNWVFKDQNMAMRWVKKHISNFGGDPNLVTIFGESAGGASVHYHMMSPASQGLFHRAILHSGTANCNWANSSPGRQKLQAKKLGKVMGCPTEDNVEMIECLRTKDAKDLIAADKYFYDWDFDPMIPFRPVIEPPHKDAFLTEDSRVILKKGNFTKVPMMLGVNQNEGAIKSAGIFGVPGLFEEFAENFDDLAPISLDYRDSDQIETITKAIKEFYFKGKTLTKDMYMNVTDMCSDVFFTAGIDETLQFLLPNTKEPVYFYHFTFKGKHSFSEIFGDSTRDYGACHVDELVYLFNLEILPKLTEKKELDVSDALLTIWTNFAYSGNPMEPRSETRLGKIPKWPTLNSDKRWKHLEIGNSLVVNEDLYAERRFFWRKLPLWQKRLSRAYTPEKTEL